MLVLSYIAIRVKEPGGLCIQILHIASAKHSTCPALPCEVNVGHKYTAGLHKSFPAALPSYAHFLCPHLTIGKHATGEVLNEAGSDPSMGSHQFVPLVVRRLSSQVRAKGVYVGMEAFSLKEGFHASWRLPPPRNPLPAPRNPRRREGICTCKHEGLVKVDRQ